jgi:galactokinase
MEINSCYGGGNKMKTKLINDFERVYGKTSHDDLRIFFAPGRVNLIGEHIDYNGGHVLPCALSVGTYAIVRKREDNKLRFFSENFQSEGIREIALDHILFDKNDGWTNYPKGIVSFFQAETNIKSGFDVLYYGNIPNGAGLSSSASIELVTAVMINELYEVGLQRMSLVLMGQRVENDFIGVNCGIMDQFAVGMGKKDHAMILNCNTLEYTYLPLELEDYALIIANTNKRRGLADSAYNERRLTCESALGKLKQSYNIDQLVDLEPSDNEKYEPLLLEQEEKCVRHVVTENDRTKKAVDVLLEGDLIGFGKLMNKSHRSLRDDYEVTGTELDTLVELAWKHSATIGARMTGAGFGGCTFNLIKKEQTDEFIKSVGQQYKNKIGYEASFYTVEIGDGAKEIMVKEGSK